MRTVLIVTELYPNAVSSPYLGKFLVEQLRYLKRRNRVVIITTHRIPVKLRHVLRRPSCQIRDGIEVYWIPLVPVWFVLQLYRVMSLDLQLYLLKGIAGWRMRALARNLHKDLNFDVVHGYETGFGDEAADIGRELGVPSVFTLCGIYSHHAKCFGRRIMSLTIHRLNNMDRLIAVSSVSAKSYQVAGVNRQFSIIPSGVNIPERNTERMLPQGVLRFTRDKFVLLTAGSFIPIKRMEMSMRVLARLHRAGMDDTVLIIAGSGSRHGFVQVAAQEGISDSVMIVGEIKPSDMTAYFRVADVLVHPSVVEGQSMVCLEAMSHGKPVVCTSNIGLVEFLEPAKDAVVIPPDDPNALFQALVALIRNPDRRRRMGENARSRAEHLSLTKRVREIEAVYDAVCRSE